MDFGFCSEDGKSKLYYIELNSKEGISNAYFNNEVDSTTWNFVYNKPSDLSSAFNYQLENTERDYKLQLPVQFQLSYTNQKIEYITDIILPKNLTSYFDDKNEQQIYNRIIFGIEKNGKYIVIWLDGKNGQKKIMRCKSQKATFHYDGNIQKQVGDSGGYATEVKYF